MKQLKIGEFSQKIGKHSNTVANWFSQLEEQKIHYVNRSSTTGEKVFDEIDLEIAFHIKDLREKKVSMNEILKEIGNHCKLRYFSVNDSLDEVNKPSSDLESLKTELLYLVHDVLSDSWWESLKYYIDEIDTLVNRLIRTNNERYPSIKDFLLIRKVEAELEKEALHKWSTKPLAMRMQRVFIFKKEENIEARCRFVKDYINAHFEERLKSRVSTLDL